MSSHIAIDHIPTNFLNYSNFRYEEISTNSNPLFPEITLPSEGSQALQLATDQTNNTAIRFACLLHRTSIKSIASLNQRLKPPKDMINIAKLAAEHLPFFETLNPHSAEQILELLKKIDAMRRPARLTDFINIINICSSQSTTTKADILKQSLIAIKKTDTLALQQQGLTGQAFALALQQQYIDTITRVIGGN